MSWGWFRRDGSFIPVEGTPQPETVALLFRHKVLRMRLDEGAMEETVVQNLLAWPTVKRLVAPSTGRAAVIYLSTGWFLTNWWLHDNLHAVTGLGPRGLLLTEYLFHVTLIIVAAALAYMLATAAKEAARGARV